VPTASVRDPEPQIKAEVAVVPGTDGEKMSKSSGNTIEIFGEEKAMRKKVMSPVMDSRSRRAQARRRQESCRPLLTLVAPSAVAKDFEERLRAGGLGYGI
jgi:tryptophanyl-tRNA synthetase